MRTWGDGREAGGAKTATDAHRNTCDISELIMVSIDTGFLQKQRADRVPRTLAMADVPEHPLRVFVHVPHGKDPQIRSRDACRCVREGFVDLRKRHLDALVGHLEDVGETRFRRSAPTYTPEN